MLSEEQRKLGRAKNAVLDYLEQHLSIPKIYLDAEWNGHQVDVLAINRDGVGDVHAVLLFPNDYSRKERILDELTGAIDPIISQFEQIPAQYKYIASVDVTSHRDALFPGLPHPIIDRSSSPDGIGRIGFLAIDFTQDGEPRTTTLFKPERFRAKIAKLATDYVEEHEPDWEIRA